MRQQFRFEEGTPRWYHQMEATSPVSTLAIPSSPLDKYLANVRDTLTGMSETEKDAVLDEMRQHLLMSARAYEELGETPEQAMQSALEAFGASQSVGQGLSTTYQTTGAARARFPVAAMCRSLRIFAVAMIAAIGIMFSTGGTARSILPWTESPVYTTFCYHASWMVVFLLPVIAGWRAGRAGLPRAALGTFYALALLALASAPLILPSLTHSEYVEWRSGLALVSFFFTFWMPTGVLASQASATLAGRRAHRLHRARG